MNHFKTLVVGIFDAAVLTWFQEKPPLDEGQLEQLYIEMEDFLVSIDHLPSNRTNLFFRVHFTEYLIYFRNVGCIKSGPALCIARRIRHDTKRYVEWCRSSSRSAGRVADVYPRTHQACQAVRANRPVEFCRHSLMRATRMRKNTTGKSNTVFVHLCINLSMILNPFRGFFSLQAVANESGINFISVKGPELLNMVYFLINICFSFPSSILFEFL